MLSRCIYSVKQRLYYCSLQSLKLDKCMISIKIFKNQESITSQLKQVLAWKLILNYSLQLVPKQMKEMPFLLNYSFICDKIEVKHFFSFLRYPLWMGNYLYLSQWIFTAILSWVSFLSWGNKILKKHFTVLKKMSHYSF